MLTSTRPLVSIVIDNYNYAEFLREAIDSALGQTYGPEYTEVVVVDDGSTDQSREIISSYAGRITPILKENRGQASALNAGFVRSRGEIVIFLDADDFLIPSTVERIVSVWRSGLAKVHYRVRFVGRGGESLGKTDPPANVPLPSGDLRGLLFEKGTYPCPPMSGNAFARSVLSSVLPVPEREYRVCADGYVSILVPFYGEVISIDEVLAAYRLHGANRWSRGSVENLALHVNHELQKLELLAAKGASIGCVVPDDLPWRNYRAVLNRLACLRLAPDMYPVKGDRPLKLACWGICAVWRWSGLPWWKRTLVSLWFLLASFLPTAALARLVFPERRPRLLRALSSHW